MRGVRVGGSLCTMVLVISACGSSPGSPDAATSIDARADAPGAGISIAPATTDFGSVSIAVPSTYVGFAVSTGSPTGPTSISIAGTNAADFTTLDTCAGVVLAPPATCTVWVRFAPSAPGAKSAQLVVTGSPGGTTMAALVGTGTSGGASLTLAPTTVSFGNVPVGPATVAQRMTVTNAGNVNAAAVTTTLGGADPSAFRITTDTCTGQTLGPAATCVVDVQFLPTSIGSRRASIGVTTISGSAATGALTGTGFLPPAALAITSPATDFGTVPVGATSAPITFTATNTGGSPTAALTTSIVQSPTQFAIVADACSGSTLPSGGSCAFQVRFTATQFGVAGGTLRVGDGSVLATASLSAVGVSNDDFNVLSPSIADFPATLVGATSAAHTFTLTNIGGTTHGPITVTLGGAAPGAFTVVHDICAGTALAPGAFCTFDVMFSPTSSGVTTAIVQLAANPGGTASALLRGTGLDPVVAAGLR